MRPSLDAVAEPAKNENGSQSIVTRMTLQQAEQAKARLSELFDELLVHDGYADLSIEMRILKRGQKEVVIRCGKQYRYVVDFMPAAAAAPRD